jgi:type I restriction enzyme, S subunit
MSQPWPMVSLGEVLSQYHKYIEAPEPRPYPKLSVKLYGKGVILDPPTDGSTLRMNRHQLAKSGQVILSEIWGKKGAIGFVPPGGEGALCTSHFFLFDVYRQRLEPRWLEYVFIGNYLQEQLDLEAKGTTGYAAVRPAHLLKATIPLPPLDQQRRIVATIEALAAKIEEAKKLRQEARNEVEVLLKAEMGRSFSLGNRHQKVPVESICAAITDNLHKNPVYADDGVPCVRSPDVGWGKLNLQSAQKTSEEEYRCRTARGEPKQDDIVLVREGGGTGKAALVEPGQRFSLGQRVMMIRPDKSKVLPLFFLYQLLSPLIFEEQIVPLSKGSASPHLNIGALRSFTFRLPELAEQERIVTHLNRLRNELDGMRQHQAETGTELQALLPAILDRAFKGEL